MSCFHGETSRCLGGRTAGRSFKKAAKASCRPGDGRNPGDISGTPLHGNDYISMYVRTYGNVMSCNVV